MLNSTLLFSYIDPVSGVTEVREITGRCPVVSAIVARGLENPLVSVTMIPQ